MNPNRPLTREMLEELQKGHPSALIELVMRMQEALEEMRQEVGRLQRRVARHHLEVRQVVRNEELSLVSVTR